MLLEKQSRSQQWLSLIFVRLQLKWRKVCISHIKMLEILLYFFKQRVKHHLHTRWVCCFDNVCTTQGRKGEDLLVFAICCTEHIRFMWSSYAGVWSSDCLPLRPPVKDVSVTRWRRTNYVMGTQPVRRAINLGKAEMTGGPGLLTVKATATLRFHASLTSSRRVLYSGFLSRTPPDFPKDPSHKIISGFVGVKPLKIGQLI